MKSVTFLNKRKLDAFRDFISRITELVALWRRNVEVAHRLVNQTNASVN